MSGGHLCEAEAPTEPTGEKTPSPPSADGGTLYSLRSASGCRGEALQERASPNKNIVFLQAEKFIFTYIIQGE